MALIPMYVKSQTAREVICLVLTSYGLAYPD